MQPKSLEAAELIAERADERLDPARLAPYRRTHLPGAEGPLAVAQFHGGKANLTYLLNNIIEPSSEIQDDYRMVVITSRDGRTYSGNIIGENDRQVTLRVIGQDQLVLNKSDIQSQETASVSLMPEGLIETLTDKEVVDLIGYLRTNRQPAL